MNHDGNARKGGHVASADLCGLATDLVLDLVERLAEAGDRIPLPGIQLRWKQPLPTSVSAWSHGGMRHGWLIHYG